MRVLIVKTSALGDIVHAFPAVAFIKATHPEATIDWVVEGSCAALVAAHPDVARTLQVDTKGWRKGFLI
jgi:heptosyltransferase-1